MSKKRDSNNSITTMPPPTGDIEAVESETQPLLSKMVNRRHQSLVDLENNGYGSSGSSSSSVERVLLKGAMAPLPWVLLRAICSAAMGSVVFGFGLSFSAPVLEGLSKTYELDDATKAMFGSFSLLGQTVGALTAELPMDRYGRTRALMMTLVLMAASYSAIAMSQDFLTALAGRTLTGYCNGLISSIVPTYVTEVVPISRRGNLSSICQTACTFGIFVAYTVGGNMSWRMTAGVGSLLSMIGLVAVYNFSPESPIFLCAKGDEEGATAAERRLGMEGWIDYGTLEHDSRDHRYGFKATFGDKRMWRVTTLAFVLPFLLACMGISPLLSYTATLFKQTGLADPALAESLLGLLKMFSSFFALGLLDRLGRKAFFGAACLGCFLSLSYLAFYFHNMGDAFQGMDGDVILRDSNGNPRVPEWQHSAAVVAVFTYMFFFSGGAGSVPITLMSEISPTRARSVIMSTSASFSWFMSFLLTLSYPLVAGAFSPFVCFAFFAADALFLFFFVLVVLPETKGKSSAAIERIMCR
eukprot:Clim_evm80s149 gene=Clim_evmTU80s149